MSQPESPFEIEVGMPAEKGPTRLPDSGNAAKAAPAQEVVTEGTASSAPVPEKTPLVSPRVAAVLAVLATVAGVGAGILSAPVSGILAVAALGLGLVAGTAVRVPAFTVGRPLVSAALAVPLGGLAVLLAQYASTLPDGTLQSGVMLAAVVCAVLAGVPVPQPSKR